MAFKAGAYFIGDPCYVLSEKDWDKILNHDGHNVLRGKDIFFAGTAHGDGTYLDQDGNEYPVDMGCIGIVDASLVSMKKIKEVETRKMGKVFNSANNFEVSAKNGNFTFGDNEIITDGSDEEDEWEDCGCCRYHYH